MDAARNPDLYLPPRYLRSVHPDERVQHPDVGDEFARSQVDLFEHLVEAVGDLDALWALDDAPLPDEPFDWSAVEGRDSAFVREVLELSDRCCDALLDVEYRTVARRMLARVATRDPRPFRRSPHAARCAASLIWLSGQAGREFTRRGRPYAAWIWSWFDVPNWPAVVEPGRSRRPTGPVRACM
jgi:hypothetical protein